MSFFAKLMLTGAICGVTFLFGGSLHYENMPLTVAHQRIDEGFAMGFYLSAITALVGLLGVVWTN